MNQRYSRKKSLRWLFEGKYPTLELTFELGQDKVKVVNGQVVRWHVFFIF